MTKTPYELRYDLLVLAQSILSEQNMNERLRLENDWHAKCETARGNGANLPPFPFVPQYDEDHVVTMAKKLNDFVSKND